MIKIDEHRSMQNEIAIALMMDELESCLFILSLFDRFTTTAKVILPINIFSSYWKSEEYFFFGAFFGAGVGFLNIMGPPPSFFGRFLGRGVGVGSKKCVGVGPRKGQSMAIRIL